MTGFATVADVAAAVGVSPAAVRVQCRSGVLEGAVKLGRDWLVPERFADPSTYRAAVGGPGRRRSRRGL